MLKAVPDPAEATLAEASLALPVSAPQPAPDCVPLDPNRRSSVTVPILPLGKFVMARVRVAAPKVSPAA